MGVAGSGKTTIGRLLSQQTGFPFFDADEFHPPANIKKMQSGQALTDDDRWPWLQNIHAFATAQIKTHSIIIACSALKKQYRELLSREIENQCNWIYLQGQYDTILQRMNQRSGHFMPTSLLQSQFDTLEIPNNAFTINIEEDPVSIVQKIILNIQPMQAFGLIGLGVMGKSLCRNLAGKGIRLSLYNRHLTGIEENIATEFVASYPELKQAKGFDQLPSFVASLQKPRKIFLMVPAGDPVDEIIQQLIPLLDKNDVVIDGGNSFFKDTAARLQRLEEKGILYIGTGVSGGEEGALKGPSIMAGGSKESYAFVKEYIEAIAAKDSEQKTCCAYIGKGGAGHFVKMVHNGIEYAEMQLLAEVYAILRFAGNVDPNKIAQLLKEQRSTELNSYLLEITSELLPHKEGDQFLIDLIVDQAGNKGTGNWATVAACELGVPIPVMTAALFARYQSEFLAERKSASLLYPHHQETTELNIAALFKAYQLARIINHHQGFHLIEAASVAYNWEINLPELARIWTNGCIIRSELMASLKTILHENKRILLHPIIAEQVRNNEKAFYQLIATASIHQIAIPCLSAAANYLLTYMQEHSSANIIQAQRDFFGAHTYQRKDDPSGKKYHTNWTTK